MAAPAKDESAAAAAPAPVEEGYTAEEVHKHETDSDCWMVIDGKVYDVTSFLTDHPGGPEQILEYAGCEATSPFNEISHTKSARNMLKDYLKGPMRPSELDKLRRSKPGKAKVSKAATATTGAKADAEGSSTLSTYLPYLIPLAMLISALYFHFFSGKTAAAAPGQTEL